VKAKPDPEALAARLFSWELRGHYDTFYGVVKSYADVLGEKGLAQYRRLAEEEWAKARTLGPDRAAWHYDRRRSRLTNNMRSLAKLSGDVRSWWPSRARTSLAPAHTCG
jgi:formylglycine-generating enzyme required for sulfatase activity